MQKLSKRVKKIIVSTFIAALIIIGLKLIS